MQGTQLVKGTEFRHFVDVGDPLSQAMIYDAQGADEIAIVDIDASRQGRAISPEVISRMITRCHLPVAAGGGIRSVEDAHMIFRAGADKLIVNSAAVVRPALVRELAEEFGSQSVVGSIDVRRDRDGRLAAYIFSGQHRVDADLPEIVECVVAEGVGELLVTSIDREGTLSGLDLELYEALRQIVPVPLIAAGGAGTYDHLVDLFERTDADACGIGKMLFLRDYDVVRIKSYLHGRHVDVREA